MIFHLSVHFIARSGKKLSDTWALAIVWLMELVEAYVENHEIAKWTRWREQEKIFHQCVPVHPDVVPDECISCVYAIFNICGPLESWLRDWTWPIVLYSVQSHGSASVMHRIDSVWNASAHNLTTTNMRWSRDMGFICLDSIYIRGNDRLMHR